MKPEESKLRFFLGANTPQGFVSRFDQFIENMPGWRTYIIKGGPGSGKSTMMRTLAEQFGQECPGMELIHCSSDADSLDGVIWPEKRLSIADGTAPHVMEPKYPGAVESLVDVTACWDEELLYSCRDQIKEITERCSRCHAYCCRFLGAAASLLADTYRIALDSVDVKKLSAYLERLSAKELKPLKDGAGCERVRFLSALTNKGIVKFTDTAKLLAQRIYLINDEHGAVSRLVLNHLRSRALAAGYGIITCYCPLAPYEKIEHLFLPQLGLGFVTSNRFHDFDLEIDPYRIINAQRFTDKQKTRVGKKRMNFNRKAAVQMVEQAEALLREAKTHHDELEGFYISATDFRKVGELTQTLGDKIGRLGA